MNVGKYAKIFLVKKNIPRSWLTITTSSTNLLIILFDTGWWVKVNDKTNIGFVDTHAKGGRGYQHSNLTSHEHFLLLCSLLKLHATVVITHFRSLSRQYMIDNLTNFLGSGSGSNIDNANLSSMFLQQPSQLNSLFNVVLTRQNIEADIFSDRWEREY